MHVLILTFCLLQSIINANGINIDSLIIREDLDDRGKRYLPKTKIPYEGIVYKKYSLIVFGLDNKLGNLCAIFAITCPLWDSLIAINLGLYLFCFYLALLGYRLFISKNL